MIDRHIRSILGTEGAIDCDGAGTPRVAPRSEEQCALVLATASEHAWRVRIDGGGNWIPSDAPADLALSTRLLSGVTQVSSADLVATARGGTVWSELRVKVADEGMWLPMDPPGSGRSLGSVLATGSAGPLRTGFGAARSRVLGLTLVTGDGRIVRAGGKVVKNVAGYDLSKLATGSFGAFGVITSAHLRLSAAPRVDITAIVRGERDSLLQTARDIIACGATPAALELLSPCAAGASEWTLAVRSLGSGASVTAELTAVSAAAAPATFLNLAAPAAAEFWQSALEKVTRSSTTIRLGTLPSALDDALDVLAHHLDEKCEDWVMVSVLDGVIRWSGETSVERLRLLRHVAAQREMPVTLERAPWPLREAFGHFGAYREGVGRLVESLRTTFDRNGVLVVPLGNVS